MFYDVILKYSFEATTDKALFFIVLKVSVFKMIIQLQFISSRTLELIFKLAIFSAPSFLEKINCRKSRSFFLYIITRYAFELFTAELFSTLDFVSVQNNLNWMKTIKNNLVLAKMCQHKKTLIRLDLPLVLNVFRSLNSFSVC